MVVVILIIITSLIVFYNWYPPFGARASRAKFTDSPNFRKRKFVNTSPTPLDFDAGGVLSLAKQELGTHPNRKPRSPLQLRKPDFAAMKASSKPQFIWLGHSTFIVWIGGKVLLFDPVFSKRTSPFWGFGPARFSGAPQLTVADLPPIDAVIISHDHYDHLDYNAIRSLRSKSKHFFVPLGVGAHLSKWGVKKHAISELDWWDEATFGGIQFICTPSRHFSGRSLTDRYATLWASWVIRAEGVSLFFSGDSGYGPHFAEIGKKYGPFDLTMMECGQYDALWPHVHMMPEQTVQAHRDLRGKTMVPMHWGAFVLALHDWTDPIERVLAAAKETDEKVATPQIGEMVAIEEAHLPMSQWWLSYVSNEQKSIVGEEMPA